MKSRGKPIITMLEEIRLYIVNKMTTQRQILSKTKGNLCPRIYDKLKTTKKDSGKWLPTWMGDLDVAKFEVKCKLEKYKFNLTEGTCACRVQVLIEVPCVHAIAAMGWTNQKPEEFVHAYLTKKTFTKAYQPLIQLVNGPNFWVDKGRDPM